MPKLLRIKEVREITRLGTTTIYKEMANGRFPKRIKIGERNSAWVESEVIDWINARIADRV